MKILGISVLFTLLLISGIYLKVVDENKPKFNIGDCILAKGKGYWETNNIKKIIYIDKDAELYGITYIEYYDMESHPISHIEYNYRKVECPN